jgi:LacI family transcriptional regulator
MRIAMLFDTSFALSAEVYEGVAEVARASGWDLIALHSSQEGMLRQALVSGTLGGVIAPFMSDRWIEGLPAHTIPMVNVAAGSQIHVVPSVVPDDRAVGRLAARHLIQSGHHHVGCIHQPSDWASCCRFEGFCDYAHAHGIEVLTPLRPESFSPTAGWEAWLQELDRPVGIFSTDDFLARRLISLARAASCVVPDDVAVVGVGNSALDSMLAGIGISSVVLPLRQLGQRAAQRLARALSGDLEPDTERVVPERVVIRESSACIRQQDPLVARALAIMDTHLDNPPTIEVLAARLGASKRTLETRFRTHVGRTPAAELRERRLSLARQLLCNTQLTLAEIATQCGYADQHHFSAQFKRLTGMPPGQWRRRGACV